MDRLEWLHSVEDPHTDLKPLIQNDLHNALRDLQDVPACEWQPTIPSQPSPDEPTEEIPDENPEEPIPPSTGFTVEFDPNTIAEWIAPTHRIYLCLLNSLYAQAPSANVEGYINQTEFNHPRVAVWQKDRLFFVGCRGTSIGKPRGEWDVVDDLQVANLKGEGSGSCGELSIVYDAVKIVQELINRGVPNYNISIAGHSLGGRAANCVALQFRLGECVMFNAAAPITNPIKAGLGPDRATHYHIVGDMISTHVHAEAAKVIRVLKNVQNTSPYEIFINATEKKKMSIAVDFGIVDPHILKRFLKSDPGNTQVDATTEDVLFLNWIDRFSAFSLPPLTTGIKLSLIRLSGVFPIPNSVRYYWMEDIQSACKNPWRFGNFLLCWLINGTVAIFDLMADELWTMIFGAISAGLLKLL